MKDEFNYGPPPELIHWPIRLPDEFNMESGVDMSQSVFEGIVRDLRK